MDSLELYHEEERLELKQINKNLSDLEKKIQKLIDIYEPPKDELEVKGSVEVSNQIDEVTVSNLKVLTSSINDLKDQLSKVIKDNSHKPLENVYVKNVDELKSKEVAVSNLKDYSDKLDDLIDIVNSLDLNVNVEKQDVQFPTGAKNAIPVRLSDGKSYYKAQYSSVVSGMQEVDPLVGYQPSDEDKSGDPVYYGFVRKDGSWYIMQNNKTNGTYRYAWGTPKANGGGLYSDAWANRAGLTYGYFYEAY